MSLPAANLLGQATSPYLLQHAANPVHWRQWGALLFFLIGCHWVTSPVFDSSDTGKANLKKGFFYALIRDLKLGIEASGPS